MRDFFDMYQDEMPPMDIYTFSILSRGIFSECNKKLLMDCVEAGLLKIPPEKIGVVNDTIVNVYKGYLKGVLDGTGDGDTQEQVERYLACFENILEIYQS